MSELKASITAVPFMMLTTAYQGEIREMEEASPLRICNILANNDTEDLIPRGSIL